MESKKSIKKNKKSEILNIFVVELFKFLNIRGFSSSLSLAIFFLLYRSLSLHSVRVVRLFMYVVWDNEGALCDGLISTEYTIPPDIMRTNKILTEQSFPHDGPLHPSLPHSDQLIGP